MLSRREFILASSVVAIGATATACATGPKSPDSKTPKESTFDSIIGRRTQTLQYIAVGTELLSSVTERLTFGLATPDGLAVGATGDLWIATSRTAPALGPFAIEEHGDGLSEDRSFYSAQVEFPADGSFQVLVDARVDGKEQIAAGSANVGRVMQMPRAGDKAISTPTPTTDAPKGVNPICTRRPACGMHEVSLDDAMKGSAKIIVAIGTPAYCSSKLCGPEIDMIEEIRGEYASLTFIHIEVLANDDPDTVQRFSPLSPASLAWKLEQEPVLYAIGSDGIITERWLGPVDRAEIRGIADRLNA